MKKGKNTDLLKLIHEHTHLKNEDGEDVPFFCFTSDIMDTVDLDMSEEEIAQVALDNGYKVYKAFPEETMIGGLILCAEGCPKEAIDKMYQEFYGDIPTIKEWPIKEEIVEEKEEIDLEPIDQEEEYAEAIKDSEQFKKKFIDKASSRDATIEFYTKVSPKRIDSTWYDGDIALIEYKDFEILISVHGDLKIDLDGTEEPLRSVEELESYRIFTDEQIQEYGKSNSLYFHDGNWFEFSIKRKQSGVWVYSDELGYDIMGDLNSALDIDFYIDTVIPDVIERYYRTNEYLNEEKKKDPRLAQAGVSGYNKPKRTPKHPTKSHVVVAKDGDKIKTIRFGEQGAEVAGKPKDGESERMKAKRKSFRARHNCDTATDKLSARYWACRVKW